MDLGGEPKHISSLEEYNPNYIIHIHLYTYSQVQISLLIKDISYNTPQTITENHKQQKCREQVMHVQHNFCTLGSQTESKREWKHSKNRKISYKISSPRNVKEVVPKKSHQHCCLNKTRTTMAPTCSHAYQVEGMLRAGAIVFSEQEHQVLSPEVIDM